MKICIATSTRADWGLLSPLAAELRRRPGVELQILATNMHLMPEYGMTVDEIERQGFVVSARVPMPLEGQGEAARVRAMAECMDGTAQALRRLAPDMLVILGDRYEMLAIASAATVMTIPIAHIAGGEVSEGAIDDNIRHAITKLSALHFTATEPYRRRVIQMGEDPARVVNAGALGVWNILNQPLMTLPELEANLGFKFAPGRTVVATFHPVTRANESIGPMLDALDAIPGLRAIITYPNNDAGSEPIIERIRAFAAERPDSILVVKSLGMIRYLSAVRYAAAVVGNSSSGIVEVPSLGVPTVDIGTRQQGRLCGPSVLHCPCDTPSVTAALRRALTPEHQALASRRENPYHRPDTVRTIADTLLSTTPTSLSTLTHKHFHDLPQIQFSTRE